MSVPPFKIDVQDSILDDLRERLGKTRFIAGTGEDNWDKGTSVAYLKDLCGYWLHQFDWRKQETYLNSFRQFRADVDGLELHFVYEKGKGDNSIPLLLIHGWPDSFVRFLKVIPLLIDPAAHGAAGAPSFDVIVPSLPGFGFSDKPRTPGLSFQVGDLLHKLMVERLGIQRFAVQGGDWGSMVAEDIVRNHSSSIIGVHLTEVPFFHAFQKSQNRSPAEEKYFAQVQEFQKKESAYALIQSTKPQSLASGLNDSPAGLAAWIVEKFRSWSDCQGNIETCFSRDEILTNITIYWVTQTIESSFLPYYEITNAGPLRWMLEGAKPWLGSRDDVPAGFALFPRDLVSPPREWAERFFNVQHWTEMPRGGHFAAMEQPELFVGDIRAMFGALTQRSSTNDQS
jgi:pimeloyl-ACP methyl ester carboxylesterase